MNKQTKQNYVLQVNLWKKNILGKQEKTMRKSILAKKEEEVGKEHKGRNKQQQTCIPWRGSFGWEGLSKRNKRISISLGDEKDPANYLVALKYIEAFKNISGNEGDKVVFMPFESSSVLSSLGGIKELFKEGK